MYECTSGFVHPGTKVMNPNTIIVMFHQMPVAYAQDESDIRLMFRGKKQTCAHFSF